jgi:hypothetical protein
MNQALKLVNNFIVLLDQLVAVYKTKYHGANDQDQQGRTDPLPE